MTAAASSSRTMPTQGASTRSKQDLTKQFLEQYNKASVDEKIRMFEILSITYGRYQLDKELREASISGTVSDEKLAQFKRRSNELEKFAKEKKPRAAKTNSAFTSEETTTSGSDTGNNNSPLARALKKIAERSLTQTKENQEAKRNWTLTLDQRHDFLAYTNHTYQARNGYSDCLNMCTIEW